MNSNGATPEEQIQQILAVTPILPGQKSNEKNVIPPSHQQSNPTDTLPPATSHSQVQPPAHPQSDLTDFGSGRTHANDENEPKARGQTELEQTLQTTSTGVHQGPLLDFSGMKQSLPVAGNGHVVSQSEQVLRRQDTEEGGLDEFVDARG